MARPGLINWCSYGFDKTVDARVDSIGQKENFVEFFIPNGVRDNASFFFQGFQAVIVEGLIKGRKTKNVDIIETAWISERGMPKVMIVVTSSF